MNCKNCGAELNEGSAFCGNCGMKIEEEQPVFEEPTQGEYYQENYNEYQEQGSYVPPVMPEYPAEPVAFGERPNTVLWIVLSAIEIFTCCQITGIISLIFSIIGHISAEKGDFADAGKKLKIAKTSFCIGLALGLIFVVAYIVIFGSGIGAGITEEIFYY